MFIKLKCNPIKYYITIHLDKLTAILLPRYQKHNVTKSLIKANLLLIIWFSIYKSSLNNITVYIIIINVKFIHNYNHKGRPSHDEPCDLMWWDISWNRLIHTVLYALLQWWRYQITNKTDIHIFRMHWNFQQRATFATLHSIVTIICRCT